MCWYKNAGVAGYAEAFRPVQSDSQTSEWYSYFENDVLANADRKYPPNLKFSGTQVFCTGEFFIFFYILSEEATSDRSLSVLLQNGCEALQNPEAALHAQYFRFRISDG